MIIISVLLHLVFLFSHVIGESVRGIKSIVKARYFWSLKGEAKLGSSRLLCPYIVNSKLQRQIGIGSKTATFKLDCSSLFLDSFYEMMNHKFLRHAFPICKQVVVETLTIICLRRNVSDVADVI